MSNNLNLPMVAAAQNQKEVTINDQATKLDAAMTDFISVNMAAAVTLTTDQFRLSTAFFCTGNTAAVVLTVPAIRRMFVVFNGGTSDITVQRTSSSGKVVLSAGASALMYSDGTQVLKIGV